MSARKRKSMKNKGGQERNNRFRYLSHLVASWQFGPKQVES